MFAKGPKQFPPPKENDKTLSAGIIFAGGFTLAASTFSLMHKAGVNTFFARKMRVENEDSFYAAESLPKPRVRLSIEHFASCKKKHSFEDEARK